MIRFGIVGAGSIANSHAMAVLKKIGSLRSLCAMPEDQWMQSLRYINLHGRAALFHYETVQYLQC